MFSELTIYQLKKIYKQHCGTQNICCEIVQSIMEFKIQYLFIIIFEIFFSEIQDLWNIAIYHWNGPSNL